MNNSVKRCCLQPESSHHQHSHSPLPLCLSSPSCSIASPNVISLIFIFFSTGSSILSHNVFLCCEPPEKTHLRPRVTQCVAGRSISPMTCPHRSSCDLSSLSSHLPEFCSKADLLCFPEDRVRRDGFRNYASEDDRVRRDSFRNYAAEDDRVRRDSFRNYAVEDDRVNKWVIEPGMFFREFMLKSGAIMPMPDICDKLPKRSFLPRVIVSKLPFSTSKLADLRRIFHAVDDSGSMTKMLTDSLAECERAPSPGETKRSMASIEDMVDFATSVLDPNFTARTTESARGHNGEIKIGKVKGVNGGGE